MKRNCQTGDNGKHCKGKHRKIWGSALVTQPKANVGSNPEKEKNAQAATDSNDCSHPPRKQNVLNEGTSYKHVGNLEKSINKGGVGA